MTRTAGCVAFSVFLLLPGAVRASGSALPKYLLRESHRQAPISRLTVLNSSLILREGESIHAFDALTLQPRWVYEGELVDGPLVAGGRLFIITQRTVTKGAGRGERQSTVHSLLELEPATGASRREWAELESNQVRAAQGCNEFGIIFDRKTALAVTAESQKPVWLKLDWGKIRPKEVDWNQVGFLNSRFLLFDRAHQVLHTVGLPEKTSSWSTSLPVPIAEVSGCGEWMMARGHLGEVIEIGSTGELKEMEGENFARVLSDKEGRTIVLDRSHRLSVQGPTPDWPAWSQELGEAVAFMAPGEGFLAVATGSGRLLVFGLPGLLPRSVGLDTPTGTLEIEADPYDAALWLDGIFLGRSTKVLEGLAPGRHQVRLAHPDRMTFEGEIDVPADGKATLPARLESPRQSALVIEADRDLARVYLDGKYVGKTPLAPFYDVAPGQVVRVEVRRIGYRKFKDAVKVLESGARVSARMVQAPLLAAGFVGGGESLTSGIKGWREPNISTTTVAGEPVRSEGGDLAAWGVLELPIGRWAPFLQFETDGSASREGVGLWGRLGDSPPLGRIEFGVAYARVTPADQGSSPPSDREGRSRKDAPLEEWRHPIPNVFTRNQDRDYLMAQARFRPRADLLLEVAFGRLFEGHLQGTPLEEDASGHLVRADERSYKFDAVGGSLVEARIRWAFGGSLSIWKIRPSTALELRYSRRSADFGIVRESAEGLSLGLGTLVFLN